MVDVLRGCSSHIWVSTPGCYFLLGRFLFRDCALFFFIPSNLVSHNDDISKKSSNVIGITNSENPSKIKDFKALSRMVSNVPMGIPRKI